MRFRVWKSRTQGVWIVHPFTTDYIPIPQYFPTWQKAIDWVDSFISTASPSIGLDRGLSIR